AARADMIAKLGLSAAHVDVTPLGVGEAEIRSNPTAPAELRRRLGLRDEPIVATVSAGMEHKNLPRLVRAFAAVRRRQCALVISGDLSRQEHELRVLASARGIADRVLMPGWLSGE